MDGVIEERPSLGIGCLLAVQAVLLFVSLERVPQISKNRANEILAMQAQNRVPRCAQ
jgi:hypothetical protein